MQESLIPHDMFHTKNALAILYMALILSNLIIVILITVNMTAIKKLQQCFQYYSKTCWHLHFYSRYRVCKGFTFNK